MSFPLVQRKLFSLLLPAILGSSPLTDSSRESATATLTPLTPPCERSASFIWCAFVTSLPSLTSGCGFWPLLSFYPQHLYLPEGHWSPGLLPSLLLKLQCWDMLKLCLPNGSTQHFLDVSRLSLSLDARSLAYEWRAVRWRLLLHFPGYTTGLWWWSSVLEDIRQLCGMQQICAMKFPVYRTNKTGILGIFVG